MTAKIYEREDNLVIIAAPAGEYGFGTLGLANRDQMMTEAWRMVQRAGLAKVAERGSARVSSTNMHTSAVVEYDLRLDTDLTQVPDRAKAY